jgi:hypothetical protein
MAAEQVLPRDEFSVRRRDLQNNPGAATASSTIDVVDDYGNVVTWRVETYRADGVETAFVQRNDADGGARWVMPPAVMAALRRQQASLEGQARRRGARKALATKRAHGIPVGNVDALRKARRARKGGAK